MRIRVDGHTDSTPIKVSKWKTNLDLSQARAESVKAYLIKKGVDLPLPLIFLLIVVVACSFLAHKYYSFGGGQRRDSGDAPRYDPQALPED